MSAVNEWLALLRVHEGGMTTSEGRFFNQGRPVDDYLAAALAELIRTEYLALGAVVSDGQQQVCVTHAGQLRYMELDSNELEGGSHGSR